MQPFWDDHWTWQKKGWLDQPAHFAAGFALAFIAVLFTQSALVSVCFSAAIGAYREWVQKPDRKVWLNKDWLFWFLGASILLL